MNSEYVAFFFSSRTHDKVSYLSHHIPQNESRNTVFLVAHTTRFVIISLIVSLSRTCCFFHSITRLGIITQSTYPSKRIGNMFLFVCFVFQSNTRLLYYISLTVSLSPNLEHVAHTTRNHVSLTISLRMNTEHTAF